MKFTLTFKMPDVLDQVNDYTNDEDEREEAENFARQFLEYSEYAHIEFDTEANTATIRQTND